MANAGATRQSSSESADNAYSNYRGNPAENYERYFVPAIAAPHARRVIEIAALKPGERVLDVACGTGVLTRLAAARTQPVTGLDVNPAMLAIARSVAGDASIRWYESGAEVIPLESGAYDVVLCQLGLQFMRDKPAALREMQRVLVPGGRMILSVAGAAPDVFVIMEEELARYLGADAGAFVQAVFSLNDKDELAGLIGDAGFQDVSAETDPIEASLPPPEDFLWQYILSTPLAGVASAVGADTRAALQNAVVERWGGIGWGKETARLRIHPIVATARK